MPELLALPSGELFKAVAPISATLLDGEPSGEREAPQQTTLTVLQIPEVMWNSIVGDLTVFIDEELTLCEAERRDMIEKFIRWNRAYNAPINTKPKNFPIHNSSNITAPLIKEHVHTLVAQIVQMTPGVGVTPPWVFEDMNPDWEPFIDPIERFLTLSAERDLNLEETLTDAAIECAVLGTSIVEVSHEVQERRVYRYTADGKRAYPSTVVKRNGPSTRHVPLGSFWIRNHERDPNEARWCAKELSMSLQELRDGEAIGKFYGVDKIVAHYTEEKEDDVREAENRDLGQESSTQGTVPARLKIFQIFIAYDVDRDGRYEELRLYYHRDSQTFIGRHFLPNWSGERGFVKFEYFPRTDRFYAEGIPEMLEQIQLAVSAIINRRADNATLANLKMIIKRKILKTLQPGDPLYAGKIIEANDIWNDIREFSLSEIYPSTINEEQVLRSIADRLSGMSEAAAGSASPVTRTTAAAQLALLQEQRNRLGLTISNMRSGVRKIGALTLSLYSQYGTQGKALAWMGERGRYVDAIFRLPRRVTELGLAIKTSTPTSSQNKQVKRENMIAMFNLITQMYEKILPLAQFLAPDALAEVARGLVKSARRFMEDTLETFEEISDPAEVLEGLAVLERLLPQPENLGGLEAFNRAAQTAEINDRLARMEDLYREAEASRDGDTRVSAGRERASRITPPEGNGRRSTSDRLLGGDTLFRS